jgi:hypothetical protein
MVDTSDYEIEERHIASVEVYDHEREWTELWKHKSKMFAE